MTFYHVEYNVAKSKKPNTIAEEFIKPCVLQMTKVVLGKQHSKKLVLVPLSNNIIQSKICGLNPDIFNQVIPNIKASPLKVSLWRVSSDNFYFKKINKTCSNTVCCKF